MRRIPLASRSHLETIEQLFAEFLPFRNVLIDLIFRDEVGHPFVHPSQASGQIADGIQNQFLGCRGLFLQQDVELIPFDALTIAPATGARTLARM